MISMGKSGGVYGCGNTGLPQTFSGGRKTQNKQNSIFGAKNKSSVTDIRRMLSRNSQSTQTQAANSWGQDSIVTSTLSYSESLRDQRQQTKNTTLALKKLKYQFKNISSKILRSKTSQAAKQAAGQARREIMRLKRQKQNSDSDSDSEEIDAAIAHAQAMERVAKKKAKHLEEEEMMKAAGTPCLISQYRYSMFDRAVEAESLALAAQYGSGFIAFSPLAQGLLTDKYLHGIPENSRAARATGFLKADQVTADKVRKAARLNEIAVRRGQTLAEMALAWVLRDERMTSVIVGASSVKQLNDNLHALENLAFLNDELAEIEGILRS